MAVITQVLEDGDRNFVINVTDSAATATHTIDISADVGTNTRHGAPTRLRLDKVKWTSDGQAKLSWDATADVDFLNLTAGQEDFDYRSAGGINNNAGAGRTGDVIITPDLPSNYTLTLWFRKKFD